MTKKKKKHNDLTHCNKKNAGGHQHSCAVDRTNASTPQSIKLPEEAPSLDQESASMNRPILCFLAELDCAWNLETLKEVSKWFEDQGILKEIDMVELKMDDLEGVDRWSRRVRMTVTCTMSNNLCSMMSRCKDSLRQR
jgi:hypothetical protein